MPYLVGESYGNMSDPIRAERESTNSLDHFSGVGVSKRASNVGKSNIDIRFPLNCHLENGLLAVDNN